MTDWRLGIDLGTNSLGWAALDLKMGSDKRWTPVGILAAGSRIFSDGRDPKSKASLAVARREARAMRRRRDRYLQRQEALMKHLIADGLFPADEDERKALGTLDPFELRARALDEELPLHHIGRALWHLNQRRGFKSNRKTDKPDKPGDETGKIKLALASLGRQMEDADARTFGEWLHMRRRPTAANPNGLSVRARLRGEEAGVGGDDRRNDRGDDAAKGYDFYPGRALIEEEFDAILQKQAAYHAAVLTTEVRAQLHEIVFHQRPLRAPKIGTCTLVSGDTRLAKAHPLFQQRRLLEEVNALKIVRAGEVAERLTPEQRDLLVLKLKNKAKVSFESLRKTLRLDADARFNKESENRKELKGHEVNAVMAAKTRFGNRWAHLPVADRIAIVDRLEATETDAQVAAFRDWLTATYDLTADQAEAVSNARLPQGHGRFGLTATTGLIDMLTEGRTEDGRVLVYSEAVERLGLHHSDFRTGEVHDALPYYGQVLERHVMPGSGNESDTDEKRLGKLTNPTVHIGLNQLRRTINTLIERFGPPAEIAVELARELKLTEDEKKDRDRQNRRNREEAERRSRALDAIGVPDTGANRAKLKLWEELDGDNVLGRACVYSGEMISIRRLFSPEIEIDHILPFSATLDDSNANKIVCTQGSNRFKRKRAPFETWGHSDRWEEIAGRAARLPKNKRWRFEPDAMERFEQDEGFLARQLVDTQHLARLAREYLSALYPGEGEGSSHVWVSPGRMTEMVRRKLDLNGLLPDHNLIGHGATPKNRLDHRHHAIDAIVIAIVDRSMLQKIAHESGLLGQDGAEKIVIRPPWEGFHDDVDAAMRRIVVSHRPDHGTAGHGLGATAGRLHNDTAYGLTGDTDAKGTPIVVRRKPFATLKAAEIATIRDPELCRAVSHWAAGLDGKELEKALTAFARSGPDQFRNIRRVRLTEPLNVVPIRDAAGRAYKAYKGDSNYRYDIWEMPDGKWRADVVSMFEAHQPDERPRPHPAARRIMRLHRDDILAIERDGGSRELLRVVKFAQAGTLALAPPNEGGNMKARDADKDDPFRYVLTSPGTLKKLRARKVQVDETGRVRDPGFGARTARRATRPRAAAAE